jgi:hypothetical protein
MYVSIQIRYGSPVFIPQHRRWSLGGGIKAAEEASGQRRFFILDLHMHVTRTR